jgi:ParB family chromosome partitioning protein
MTEGRLETLARNIEREGRYPPLIVRPHPDLPNEWQILDGRHRGDVLRRLGHTEAVCFVWPCDDATALVLLATLNRLEGEDVPVRRAELLAELSDLLPAEQLAALLPEDEAAIRNTLSLLDLDSERLLADLTAAAERQAAAGPRIISFAVLVEDESAIEQALEEATSILDGKNRRGRALALICRAYLDGHDA